MNEEENITMLNEFLEDAKHLPVQKSEEWLKNRINTIGASEIKGIFPTKNDTYGTMKSLIASKAGISSNTFRSNISMRLGNLYEQVSRTFAHYVTQCKTPIYETGSLMGNIKGQSYSPDGISIVDITFDDEKYSAIVLFEFKCPNKTEPNGNVPPIYMDQLQSGLSTVDIASYMLFINNAYRKCAYQELNFNPTYDTNFHDTDKRFKRPMNKVYAYGLIGFYTETYENYNYYDYGEADEYSFNNLLELVEKGTVKVHYSDISYNGVHLNKLEYVKSHVGTLDSVVYTPDDLNKKFIDYCSEHKYINIGILPWKLFKTDILLVERDPKWEGRAKIYIKKFWDIVNHIKNSEDPKAEYYKLYPDETQVMPETESMFDSDSD
jgi:hypothetical protein